MGVKGLNPQSNRHLSSPHSNTAKPFIKIMRIKEMIAALEVLIFISILLVSISRNIWRGVWRIYILYKGLKLLFPQFLQLQLTLEDHFVTCIQLTLRGPTCSRTLPPKVKCRRLCFTFGEEGCGYT